MYIYDDARRKIEQFERDGLGELPICMAKTHLSLPADPQLTGAPTDFTLPVRDIRAYTGAGWLVPLSATSSRCRASARTRRRCAWTSTRPDAQSACFDDRLAAGHP